MRSRKTSYEDILRRRLDVKTTLYVYGDTSSWAIWTKMIPKDLNLFHQVLPTLSMRVPKQNFHSCTQLNTGIFTTKYKIWTCTQTAIFFYYKQRKINLINSFFSELLIIWIKQTQLLAYLSKNVFEDAAKEFISFVLVLVLVNWYVRLCKLKLSLYIFRYISRNLKSLKVPCKLCNNIFMIVSTQIHSCTSF